MSRVQRDGKIHRYGILSSGEELSIRRLLATLLLLTGLGLLLLLLWDPYPETSKTFDKKENGLWLGHKWYTGHGVRDGKPVTQDETSELLETLRRYGIRYGFVHVGPIGEDGTLPDPSGPTLEALRQEARETRLLAWVGARVDRIDLTNATFKTNLLQTLSMLQSEGFDGVHFDFEPMHDFEDGYLEILDAVRAQMGEDFIISQATPRAGPFGIVLGPLKQSFWSEEFYRETMERSDQTVVMAYDTNLGFPTAYVTFVRHQTNLMIDWACSTPGHEALIGVPTHEDVPLYSDPEIENLATALPGVRSALESRQHESECVSGVAIYANWVTDESEWRDYETHWMNPGEGDKNEIRK